MTLKIIRSSSSLRVSEPRRALVAKTREIQFTCSACKRSGTLQIPWDVDAPERQRIIRTALDEHRRIGCTVRDATIRRTYAIEYPRA